MSELICSRRLFVRNIHKRLGREMLCNARGLSNVSFKLLLLHEPICTSCVKGENYCHFHFESKTKYDYNDCPASNVFLLELKASIENEATIL